VWRIAVASLSIAVLLMVCKGPADAEEMVKLAGNHPTDIAGEPAGPIDPARTVSMAITLKLRDPQGLQRLLSEQQDPASPNYRRWLTPREFSQRFGPDPAELKAVEQWLAGQGFEIVSASIERRSITFRGSAELAQRVFETQIVTYAGGTYANVSDPSIPERFASVIGAIGGLDNATHVVPMSQR
jgi:pseudomonalisin